MTNKTLISFNTIVRKEVTRFMRIWSQSLLPSVITTALYFVIFGNLIGPKIGAMNNYPYMQFIAPGLIMMAVINNAYNNVVSSFFGSRFQGSIDELLVSPTPNYIIILGYTAGGVLRGLISGVLVSVVALGFTHLSIHHVGFMFLIVLLCATLFALAGLTNGIFARKFDDVVIVPTFVLTPLIYLGGIFYSISLLPRFWYHVSLFNPILYMVNSFRYSILGTTDVAMSHAILIISAFTLGLFFINLFLLRKGIKIKS